MDDCTHMSGIYFLKHKSEVFDVFFKFYNMIDSIHMLCPLSLFPFEFLGVLSMFIFLDESDINWNLRQLNVCFLVMG